MMGAVHWEVWEGRYGEDGERRTLNGETTGDEFGERDQRVTEEAWRGMPLLAPSRHSPSFLLFFCAPQ